MEVDSTERDARSGWDVERLHEGVDVDEADRRGPAQAFGGLQHGGMRWHLVGAEGGRGQTTSDAARAGAGNRTLRCKEMRGVNASSDHPLFAERDGPRRARSQQWLSTWCSR